MEEVRLLIEGQTFTARKSVLCEYSDYFRAMFSGNYVENEKHEIKIDIVDANSMKLILLYMEHGLIDLSDVSTLEELALSANFLQITPLVKQMEYTVASRLSLSNWLAAVSLAESLSSKKLEQTAVAFGILNFPSMKPENIPSIHKLHWYLSHPYLEIENEMQVFEFGFDWVVKEGLSADGLLVVLSCLDIKALTKTHLNEMIKLLAKFEDSLPTKIVECLLDVENEHSDISSASITASKQKLIEKYTERVYSETSILISTNSKRMLKMVPCIPLSEINTCFEDKERSPTKVPLKGKIVLSPPRKDKSKGMQSLYKFNDVDGFDKWLDVAPKNLWGWSITSWGCTKLVVVGGEYGRGTGIFMTEVSIYDTLNKEWIKHGTSMPPRRHAGVAVLGNSLYIVGGVGTFRVVLCSAIMYDLEDQIFRKIANFPDTLQSPAVCAYQGNIYVAGHKNVYQYIDDDNVAYWTLILNTVHRLNYLTSFDKCIFGTQNYFNSLYKFRPNEDENLETVALFENPVYAVCNAGRRLIAFTGSIVSHENIAVEAYEDKTIRILYNNTNNTLHKFESAGCCALVFSIPTENIPLSSYAQKCLSLFPK